MVAVTATITSDIRKDVIGRLDMRDCKLVSASPNRPNITYMVTRRTTIEEDLKHVVADLKTNSIDAKRVIIYCRSLNMCSNLYAHFLYELKENSYFPACAPQISKNRLFGMYHSNTVNHNKELIMQSMLKTDGIVRVVFATMALGMGVNFMGLSATIHYGAPRSIDDYFQESGRAGRDGKQATSIIYWTPADAPLRLDSNNPRDAEVVAVRRYLEDSSTCRRFQLLYYFNTAIAKDLPKQDPITCCDTCKSECNPS